MKIYTDDRLYSHRVRFACLVKGLRADWVPVDVGNPEDLDHLAEISPPSGEQLPVLEDRHLVLYNDLAMLEYLEERLTYPTLMPTTPEERALVRQEISRLNEACDMAEDIELGSGREITKARKGLVEEIRQMLPEFSENPWYKSREITLLDCCLAPLLWRFPLYKINLKVNASTMPMFEYMKRVFSLDTFRASLTEIERDIQLSPSKRRS